MAEGPGIRPTASLRLRVALAVAAVLVLGGAIVLVAALAYGRAAAREVYDGLLFGAASDIAESLRVRDGAPVVSLPVSAFELLAQAPDDRVRYVVLGPDGTALTGDPATPRPPEGEGFYNGSFGSETARYVALTRRFAEREFSGALTVIVGQTTRARAALARDVARNAVLGLGLGGLAMAAFAWAAVGGAMVPLSRIGEALARRAPTDLSPIGGTAPREIAGVLGAMNLFMARLDRQAEASGKLIADTAHQLRTPVAAIRAQIQLAREEEEPARLAAALDRAEARVAATQVLLDQILARAMVNHRTDVVLRERVDLRDVAADVLDACDELIEQRGVPVRLHLPEAPVVIAGDAFSLVEAGKNLLTNALRHGGRPIVVGVGPGTLWVEDGGPGPEGALDAFAAGQAEDRGSGGLGLAIAGDVARLHEGRVALSRGPKGFRAALEFPA